MYKLSKLAAGSVIAVAAAVGGTSAVLADGYTPPRKVAYERPSDWSGFYFGLSSGWQWSSIDSKYVFGGATSSIDQNSGLVGGHIGIQHQFGQVVLGVEGNIFSTFREENGSTLCPSGTLNCTAHLDDILSVGGRLGWAAGHWMPYVTGGYANARFEHQSYTLGASPAAFAFSSERHGGWYLGGGVEWIVSPGWVAGIEYRHYEFDTVRHTPWCTGNSASCGSQGVADLGDAKDISPSTDSIMARVSWKFGREPAAPLK